MELVYAACPINKEKVDEHISRANAFTTLIFALAGILSYPLIFGIYLTLDFFSRLYLCNINLTLAISKLIVHKILKLKPKLINAGPKKFAAKVGLGFSIATVLAYFYSALATAAFLEAALGFCVGCWLYSFYNSLKERI